MPQPLPQVSIGCVGYPDRREAIFHHESQQPLRILPIGFCLRTRLARISAASPIHRSNCNSRNKRSNQRACPLASMPTRTLNPRA
jgi:hypothetical protein